LFLNYLDHVVTGRQENFDISVWCIKWPGKGRRFLWGLKLKTLVHRHRISLTISNPTETPIFPPYRKFVIVSGF
jgi:hypothetical protein